MENLNTLIKFIGYAIVFYFIGAIPTGYIIGKLKGHNLTKEGSGNIGATNTLRVLGTVWGVIVLIIDVSKAFFSLLILIPLFIKTGNFINPELLKILFSLFILLGNIFNPFFKFKGGKGVAASTGILLYLNPLALLIGLSIFIIIVGITKYVSLGSLIASVAVFLSSLLINYNIYTSIFLFLIMILIFIRHKSNIKRLLKGEENKIKFKK